MDMKNLMVALNFGISAVLFALAYHGDKEKQVVRLLYSLWFLGASISFEIS